VCECVCVYIYVCVYVYVCVYIQQFRAMEHTAAAATQNAVAVWVHACLWVCERAMRVRSCVRGCISVCECVGVPNAVCGYEEKAPYNYRSLLQNIVSFIGLFCKRNLQF